MSKTRGGEPNLLERVEEVDQVVLPLMASPILVLPRDALTAVCPWRSYSTGARGAHGPLVVWSGMRRTIGAISDTHGLLRAQALAALAGCDPIIHAGDVGSPDVLARLGALAPVHAVRGNVDHGAWSANLPVTQRIEIDGFRIYVLHILAELDPQAADNVDAVIYGHSHQPKIETKNGTLFFNPGSAGPRRFRLPITVGRMTAEHGKLRAEIVELSVES